MPTAATSQAVMPAATAYVLPMDQLEAVATDAGLQWVNSDVSKVAKAQADMAAKSAPQHVPRVIQPVVLPDEGPLMLVETRKDLSTTRFPFDPAAH